MKKSYILSLLLTLFGVAANAQYTLFTDVRTDRMYTVRNAYGLSTSTAAYNYYLYATDGATSVTGKTPDDIDLTDYGSYWTLESAQAETGQENSYYFKNYQTGAYIYFADVEALSTPAQMSFTQKTPIYLFEGGLATSGTQAGSTFLSVNGVGTDTSDARGFHANGMKVWEWAGGGNQWLFTEYVLPKYYIQSATGYYMTEAGNGQAIGLSTETSEAALWDLTAGDEDAAYTLTSNTGDAVVALNTVTGGTATVFDLLKSTTTDSAFTFRYNVADYLAAGSSAVENATSMSTSTDWFVLNSVTGKKFSLPLTADLSGTYSVKSNFYNDNAELINEIATFVLDKTGKTATITDLCPELAGQTITGKYNSRTGLITIADGTLSSNGKALSGVDSDENVGDLLISVNGSATVFKTTQSILVGEVQYYGNEEWVIGDEYPLTWSREAPAGTYNFYVIGFESGKGGDGAPYDWTTKVVVTSDGTCTFTGITPDLASVEVKGTYDVSDNSIVISKGTATSAGALSGYDYTSNTYTDLKFSLNDDHTQMTCPMAIVLKDASDNTTSWVDCNTEGANNSSSETYPLIYSSTPLVTELYVTLPFDVTTTQGLPGATMENGAQISYQSPKYHLDEATNKLRFTVMNSNTGDNADNGFYCAALSEFYLYDADGNAINLTEDMFSTNAQEASEGPLANICDGNTESTNYWHSSWHAQSTEYHYLEIALPEPIETFSFGWVSRNLRTVPTQLVVSDGTYKSVGTAEVGDQIMTLSEIETGVPYLLYGNVNVVAEGKEQGSGYYAGVNLVGQTPTDACVFMFEGNATDGYTVHFVQNDEYLKRIVGWTSMSTTTSVEEAAVVTVTESDNMENAFTLSYIADYTDDDGSYTDCVHYLQDWTNSVMGVFPTGNNGKENDTDGESDWTIFKALNYSGADTTNGHGALTTGIEDITIDTPAGGKFNNNLIYDLSGRVVSKPTKGIYIQNGKKFIVK